jgi:alginate O-acetyltransferase complex protein AlgJ
MLVTLFAATISLGLGANTVATFPTNTIGKNGFIFENLTEIGRWDQDRIKIAAKLDEHINIIQAIDTVLKKRNTKLVISLIPMVHSIYSAQLPNGFVRPKFQREIYGVLQKRLNKIGVQTPDLEQDFLKYANQNGLQEPLFMRADHHWSPSGGLESARVIAEYIQKKHPAVLAKIPSVKYDLQFAERRTYPKYSSLYKQLSLKDQARVKLDAIRVPEFSLVSANTLPNNTVPGNNPNSSSLSSAQTSNDLGLLTNTSPRIVLVGSSFSDIEEFGFVGGLAKNLSRDVLNAAHGGVGSFIPMAEYLASDAYQNDPPAMVIWEMPIKIMVFGMAPINNADRWSAKQYLLELAANLPGACQNGTPVTSTTSTGFTLQNGNASIASSTKASFVQYQFAKPFQANQYLSIKASSSTSDSLVIENNDKKPIKYFAKLGEYNSAHQINVPLATLANGKTSSLKVRVAPGSQLKLERPTLCVAAPELLRLANSPETGTN